MLSFKQRSVQEIYCDLERKGFPATLADEVVTYLIEEGYLDDHALAVSIVANGQDKHKSRPEIYVLLRSRKIDRDLAEMSLLEFYRQEKELQAIRHLVERQLKVCASPPGRVEAEKIIGKISRKGFNAVAVRSVLHKLLNGSLRDQDGDPTSFLDTAGGLS
jgi:SOS response regulatory protein OraA/RecX